MRVIIAVSAVILAATPAMGQTSLQPGETLLEVATSGEVHTPPDLATINAGVMTTGTTPQSAIDTNSQAMAKVIAELKAAGVEARNLQTSTVSLQPQMNYNESGGAPRITGYVANNNVSISLKDPTKAAKILTAAFTGGANSVNGPFFTLSNNAKALDGARAAAVARAKAQADVYANAMGMRITRVLRVSERQQMQSYDPIIVTGSIVDASAPPPPPPPVVAPVQVGQVRQTVSVWIDYAMAPN